MPRPDEEEIEKRWEGKGYFKLSLRKSEEMGLELEYLVYTGGEEVRENEELASKDIPLDEHSSSVQRVARELSIKLGFPEPLVEAVEMAAKWHDEGKRDERWQLAIGNEKYPSVVLAKSGRRAFNWKACGNYRHEFGSVQKAQSETQGMCDLVYHLIVATHARGRLPTKKVFEAHREIAGEAMLRFVKLQEEFGWWDLAYLESILKAADRLASGELIDRNCR